MSVLSRHYAKLCDLRDWDDERLLAILRDVLPERDPLTHIERKVWEFAMLVGFLEDVGRLNDDTEVLAIGAGDERIAFWLANRCGRVVCTDIYGQGDFAHREAEGSMLTDPAAHAPFPYREDRLEVLHADARELPFEEETFDVVYSLSSIEHFGQPDGVIASAREMARVLRPGGHAIVVTECFVRQGLRDRAPVEALVRAGSLGRKCHGATLRRRASVPEVFTPRELRKRIVEPSGLRLVQPLDLSLSDESWENVTRSLAGGQLQPATGNYWPHILVAASRSVFTSVCLPLEKPS